MPPKSSKAATATATATATRSANASPASARFKTPKSKAKPNDDDSGGGGGGPKVLYWHRTDLRLHDSPGLDHALHQLKPSAFYPVWCWDPHYVFKARGGANRWRFLVECMRGLSDGYRKISGGGGQSASDKKNKKQEDRHHHQRQNQHQQLWVVREGPVTVLPKLCKLWGITHLVFEGDGDWYARRRDAEVKDAVEDLGVEVVVKWGGRTLFVEEEVVKGNGGKPTMSMGQLLKAVQKERLMVPRPLDGVQEVPGTGAEDVLESLRRLEKDEGQNEPRERESGEGDINAEVRTGGESQEYVSLLGPNGDCGVPTLEEMGIDPADATGPHHGGEANALEQLKRVLDNEEYTATFEKPKTAPTDFEPRATTVLSAHLHFGSLSVRQFYWGVQDVFDRRRKAGKKVAPEPMNLIGQLMFRDMYFSAQYALGHAFQGERGNEVCRVVDWYLPSDEKGGYEVDDEQAEQWFLRWKDGRTGFPFVDALMRQLKTEGWIHHLGRHMVACFLTRGGCYVHWERGKEVFEEWLIDHESASNAGNWMWLSCTAFFSQFYRCYSPVSFGKKWDPDGSFVRKYVPELAEFDKKHIYEPHKAPLADQKKWGCQIKGDGTQKGEGNTKTYPKPMFDFNERRTACLDGMKHAYEIKMYGDDKRRLNGEWKKVFGKGEGKDSNSKKRARDEAEEEHTSDDGETAGHGDDNDGEPPKRAKTAAGGKKGQLKLDKMVSRGKKK